MMGTTCVHFESVNKKIEMWRPEEKFHVLAARYRELNISPSRIKTNQLVQSDVSTFPPLYFQTFEALAKEKQMQNIQ